MVGSALLRNLSARTKDVVGTTYSSNDSRLLYLDIRERASVTDFFQATHPLIVYLPAYISGVDWCEEHPGESDGVNVEGCINVIRAAQEMGAHRLVFFSSGYVFDGESKRPYFPNDQPSPINVYGRQKFEVEKVLARSKIPHLIIRTIGVFGQEEARKNFVYQVINATLAGKEFLAPIDQFMNPIWADDLASIVVELATFGHTGIFHVAGNKCISKFDWANDITEYIKPNTICVTSEEMKQKARRPRNACLDCSRLEHLEIDVPDYRKGLESFLHGKSNYS
jgi:dTDP-4-dehydrorhamnose reductase